MGSYLDAHHLDAPPRHPIATGGTMTTRTGEPATKRESYTQYIQGRAAAVRSTPTRVSTTALSPRVCFARRVLRFPLSAIHARAQETRGGPLTSPHHIEQQEMPDIDSVDRENPLAVTEYVNDIFSYWFRVEVRVHYCPLFSVIHLRGWPTSARRASCRCEVLNRSVLGRALRDNRARGSQLGVVRQPLDNLNAVIGDILRTLVAFELMPPRV